MNARTIIIGIAILVIIIAGIAYYGGEQASDTTATAPAPTAPAAPAPSEYPVPAN